MKLDATTAKLVLGSPDASPETLADIARDFPDLQAQVAAHPAASPELLDWLEASGTPDAQAAARDATAARLVAPPPTPATTPDPSAPVQPKHWSKRRRVAVIAGACAVAIALVVWLVVLPQLANRGTLPTPDITAQPKTSTPITLTTRSPSIPSFSAPQLLDPQVGNIAVANWTYGDTIDLQGIDLSTKTILWDVQRNDYPGVLASSGYVVLASTSSIEVIDARHGTTTATISLTSSESVWQVQNGMILTIDGTTLCGRTMANPTTCRWQAQMPDADNHYTDGWWINFTGHVLDYQTGAQAPFGRDVTMGGTSSVLYFGLDASHVVRWTYQGDAGQDPSTIIATAQPWDTVNDRGLSPVVTTDGEAGSGLTLDAARSALITTRTIGQTTQVTATDWQTGGNRWQTTMDWGVMVGAITQSTMCADTLIIADGMGLGSVRAFDANFGQQIWQGDGDTYLGQGNRVVYFKEGAGDTLGAYDAASPSFAQLWTLKLPGGATPSIVAGHIVGLAANQLWVVG